MTKRPTPGEVARKRAYLEKIKRIEDRMPRPREGVVDPRDQPAALPAIFQADDITLPVSGVMPKPKNLGGQVEQVDQLDRKIEVQLINRLAGRKDWNIPDRAYDSVPKMLTDVAEDDGAETKLRILAANALSKLHGQNTDRDRNTTHYHLAKVRIEGARPAEAPTIDADSIGSSALLEAPSLDELKNTVGILENLGILQGILGK